MLKSLSKISGVSKSQIKGARARGERLYYTIIEEIAREEGIEERKVELIIRSIFQNLAEQMRSGKQEGVSIINLGTWTMKPRQEENYLKDHKEYKAHAKPPRTTNAISERNVSTIPSA